MEAVLKSLLVALVVAVPLFAIPAPDVTLPVTGFLSLPHVEYSTEVMVTNHRDAEQYIIISFIQDGFESNIHAFPLGPRASKFLANPFGDGNGLMDRIGAMRIRTITSIDGQVDPQGQIEANAYIIADWAGRNGTSRQEVTSVPSSEYTAREAVFLGVRHSASGAYTNVGIVNMHPTQTEKFFVQFQFQEPVAYNVPPNSLIQVRIPSPGNGGRSVRVYPEWSLVDGEPARTTPWVAYASTVDNRTGDAYSGWRVPSTPVAP